MRDLLGLAGSLCPSLSVMVAGMVAPGGLELGMARDGRIGAGDGQRNKKRDTAAAQSRAMSRWKPEPPWATTRPTPVR